jgi:putative membrane protein
LPVRLLGRLVLVLVVDGVALLALSWILPGFTLDDPWSALGLAVALGVANSVVWPILLRIALPFTVATLGLGALILNAAVLLGTAALLDSVHIDGLFEALVVVLGLTLLTTLLGGVLALDRGDLWYRHIVVRQARRTQLAEKTDVPRDRRPRPGRAAARAAGRQRAGARSLDARSRLPPGGLGDRLVVADRRLPGGPAARLQ